MLELYTFVSDVTTSHCYELQFIFTFVSHLSRQIETVFVTEITFRINFHIRSLGRCPSFDTGQLS
jgi:hypothetical protein